MSKFHVESLGSRLTHHAERLGFVAALRRGSCIAFRACLLGEWLFFLLFSKSLVVRVSATFCKLFIYKIIFAFSLGFIYINSTDKPEGSRKSPLLNRCPTSVKASGVS